MILFKSFFRIYFVQKVNDEILEKNIKIYIPCLKILQYKYNFPYIFVYKVLLLKYKYSYHWYVQYFSRKQYKYQLIK